MWPALVTALGLAAGAPVLVDVGEAAPKLVLDIRYATPDNFTGRTLYPAARCLLHKEAFAKLQRAQAWLDEHARGHVLMLMDCYRPESVQRVMWEAVRGTPMASYVANPDGKTGSVHNYGLAVDATLSRDGEELDMGTPFDFLGPMASPRHEQKFLAKGELTFAQLENRLLLRRAMVEGGGFRAIRNEWWHFEAVSPRELRAKFTKLDVPLRP